ncbi:hypothetical protein ACP4OV_007061 [Aristida adscensionis]
MAPAASPSGGGGGAPRRDKRPRDSECSDSGSGTTSDSDSDGDCVRCPARASYHFVLDLREIVRLLRLIKGGANEDGQKMCQEIIASVAADIQSMLEDTKLKFEKERQNLLKVLSNSSKEQCESSLNKEYTKFQETYEMFCREKDAHIQTFRDLFSKVEVEKEKLLEQYEHHKEETATLSEVDRIFSEETTNAEQPARSVRKNANFFIVFRKTIGSSLECGSDDDFDLDDD